MRLSIPRSHFYVLRKAFTPILSKSYVNACIKKRWGLSDTALRRFFHVNFMFLLGRYQTVLLCRERSIYVI